MFSKTTDGGVTWSQGRSIFDPGEKNQTIGNQIVVPTTGPGRGVLIDGFDLILNKGGNAATTSAPAFTVAVIRSTDGGATWSQPIAVDIQEVASVTIAGHAVRSSDFLPEFAVDPATGTLYAVWQDGRFSPTGTAKIALSQLDRRRAALEGADPGRPVARRHAGLHAADPRRPGRHRRLPYYDLENATSAQPGLTDAFIAHCHAPPRTARPGSWAAGGETRLSTTGSFDYTTAPDAGGYFLGDYDGLTTSGKRSSRSSTVATIATAGRPILLQQRRLSAYGRGSWCRRIAPAPGSALVSGQESHARRRDRQKRSDRASIRRARVSLYRGRLQRRSGGWSDGAALDELDGLPGRVDLDLVGLAGIGEVDVRRVCGVVNGESSACEVDRLALGGRGGVLHLRVCLRAAGRSRW